ncbi:hypothetical protein ROA7450_03415 [Roseovarius albus]|uniref:Uncharacterized protein n=1 Tax=Roseovarius albus TaxID=1247867 RepID=A0A1X6ZXY1_9RHOB|nr:hypothetical protein [Roseovarius albus]SLN64561.1 hypothetical protein ROA7450_03415 [Roseovarius albus]
MSKYSTQEINHLWKHGYPMQNSWLTFAHPDLKTQWDVAQENSAANALNDGVEAASNADLSTLGKMTMAFSGAQDILAERGKLEKRLKANILNYIKKGYLHVFGYEAPRKVASPAIEVPAPYWNGKPDWGKGCLESQSLQFVEIRFMTPKMCEQALERAAKTASLDLRSSGRPSIKSDVKAAFQALKQQGKIDVNLSGKAHIDLIREHMRTKNPDKYPESYKLGYEGIRPHFMPLFKELVKNSKQ